jgi:pantoate--beta-alanine ligase
MEGAFRKGHFDGVGTVVKKFFKIINPNKAYFGEKDYQQLQIINKMVAINRFSIQIIPCPIFREEDGLAMSSRNVRLNKQQRNAAPLIHKTLIKSKELFSNIGVETIKDFVKKEFKNSPFLALEYFEIAEIETLISVNKKLNNKKYRAFIAAYAGEVRLIDNIALN